MTIIANKRKVEKITFSPSVNIIRDASTALNYIPTANARQAYTQLINDYQTGVRSFIIVGAFGIGKSAFLWAFEKNINREKCYFTVPDFSFNKEEFDFLRLIGDYSSLKNAFAKHLGIKKADFTTNDILNSLDKYYRYSSKSNKGLVIVIDEFGKLLEYAANNNPESELYFIQQLAEYVNDLKKNIIFITSLHQDFNGYSRNLSISQQKEWDKVKGRLKEIAFNEPVEQLLFLASERLSELSISARNENFPLLFKSIENAKAFPLKDYFNEDIAAKLLPFDILSAAVLTLGLQKYGQNERSLFSFIESNHHLGIRDFNIADAPYYNLSNVYDYFINNYYSFLTTKYNPHYAHWAAIRIAIERVEGLFNEDIEDALKLVKTIGLLNIFASASAHITLSFLSEYARYSLGILQPEIIIKRLEDPKFIRFVKFSDKYILFEGTDLDIELAIDEAGNLVQRITNVVHHLNKHFDFPYLSAKAASYARGTPRFFSFYLSETPEKLSPEGETDGFINLVFSDTMVDKDLRAISNECEDAVLYGLYRNTEVIRNLLFEIEKIEKVKENNADDRVAIRELNSILQHQVKLLNHLVLGNIYSNNSSINWYFKGKKEKITDQKSFNQLLSKICNVIYPDTPVYKNEMVNKTKLSGALATAKKNFLKNLTEKWSMQDLGFDMTKFPPEKTVYLSLLRETGIHTVYKGGYILSEPTDTTFMRLWEASTIFLQSTCNGRRNLQEFANMLLSRPFKLKKGFVDFWLPIFLFCKRDDFALYSDDGYIPFLSDDTLDLVSKKPSDFEIKAFDIGGVKLSIFNRYRILLNQSEQDKPTSKGFIETIRPFLTFYRELPEFAKHTKKLDKRTLALREAIAYSKDPEETFFDHFPKALGFNLVQLQNNEWELETFVTQLQQSIREIRTSYDGLLNNLETFILEEIIGEDENFPAYKLHLQERFKEVKKYLLLPYQRVFIQRINSDLDDRKAWLESIAQACLGKALSIITDDERPVLFEKLKDTVHELDNLCEISKSGFDENKEIAFKLEVTSFIKGLQKNLVRLPKTKNKEFVQLQSLIKAKLSNDKQLNIATLAKLLEELLKNEK